MERGLALSVHCGQVLVQGRESSGSPCAACSPPPQGRTDAPISQRIPEEAVERLCAPSRNGSGRDGVGRWEGWLRGHAGEDDGRSASVRGSGGRGAMGVLGGREASVEAGMEARRSGREAEVKQHLVSGLSLWKWCRSLWTVEQSEAGGANESRVPCAQRQVKRDVPEAMGIWSRRTRQTEETRVHRQRRKTRERYSVCANGALRAPHARVPGPLSSAPGLPSFPKQNDRAQAEAVGRQAVCAAADDGGHSPRGGKAPHQPPCDLTPSRGAGPGGHTSVQGQLSGRRACRAPKRQSGVQSRDSSPRLHQV